MATFKLNVIEESQVGSRKLNEPTFAPAYIGSGAGAGDIYYACGECGVRLAEDLQRDIIDEVIKCPQCSALNETPAG
jgi:DNA-directed RNA polymerase subunit RPC12/RpoP